jgi:hypothetical protein
MLSDTSILLLPQATTAERDTDLTSVPDGSVIFNTDTGDMQITTDGGTSWQTISDSTNSSSPTVIYVSNDGSDTTGDGTISDPYETLAYAMSQITDNSSSKPYTIQLVTGVYTDLNLALKPWVNIDGGNSQLTITNAVTLDAGYSAGGNLRIYDFGILDVISGMALDFDTLNASQSIIFMQNCRTFSNTNIEISGSTNFTYFISDDLLGFELTLNNTASILQNQIFGNVTITKDNTFPSYVVQLKSSTVNGLFTVNQNSTGIESLVINTANCAVESDSNFTCATGTASLSWNSQGDRLSSINLDGAGLKFITDSLSSIPNLTNGAIYNLRNLSNGLLANYTPSNYSPTDDSVNGHLVGIDNAIGSASSESLQTAYDNGNVIQMASGVNVTINDSLGGSVLEAVESGVNSAVIATNTFVLEKNSALGPVFSYDSQAVGADGNRIASLGSISLASDSSQKSFEVIVCDIEDSINASFTTSTTFSVKESNVNTEYLKLDGSTTYIEALKDVDMNSFWVRDVNRLTGTGGYIDLGTSSLIEVRAATRLDLVTTAGPVNIAGSSTYVESMPASSLVATDAGKFLVAGVLTGDVSTSGLTATLATVNTNVGTFGDATNIPQFTVNGKGLITGVTNVPVDFSSVDLQSAYDSGNTIQLTSERNLTVFDSLGDTILDVVEDGANSNTVMYRKGVVTNDTAAGPFLELNNSSVGVVGTELGTISVSGLASDTSFKVFNAINHEVIDASPGSYSVSQFFNSFSNGVETKYMEFDGIGQVEIYKTLDLKSNGIVAAAGINCTSLTASGFVSGSFLSADSPTGPNMALNYLNTSLGFMGQLQFISQNTASTQLTFGNIRVDKTSTVVANESADMCFQVVSNGTNINCVTLKGVEETVEIDWSTASTSTSTGSLVNSGGFGNAGDIWNGGDIHQAGDILFTADNSTEIGTSTERAANVWTNLVNGIQPSGGLFMQTADGSLYTNSTTETSILGTGVGNLTVPANTFQVSGYKLDVAGNFNGQNGSVLTLRLCANFTGTPVDLGSVVVTLENATSKFFELEADFAIRSIGAATVAEVVTNMDFTYNRNTGNEFVGQRAVSSNSTTFDTTISNTLFLTAEFDTASTSNSIQTKLATLTRTY